MSPEELMRTTLAERGESLINAPLSLADVQSRARTIRRRRTASACVGALAVVAAVTAVAVPVALSGGSPKSVTPATTGPSPSGTPSFTMRADATIPYIEQGTLQMPDGFSYSLRKQRVVGVALLASGTPVVTTNREGGLSVESPIGSEGHATTAPAVASTDGKVAAWVDPSNDAVMMLVDSATSPIRFGTVESGTTDGQSQVVAVTGTYCPKDCTVFVNTAGTAFGGEVVSSAGTLVSVAGSDSPTKWTPLAPQNAHLESLDDVSDSMAAGTLSVDEFPAADADPSCRADGVVRWSGVIDLGTGSELWRTCEARTLDLSPSSTYAVAAPTQSDGLGPRRLELLSGPTGERLGSFGDDRATIMDWAWEDDTHVLAAVIDDDGVTWKLMRYDVISKQVVTLRVLTGKPADDRAIVLP